MKSANFFFLPSGEFVNKHGEVIVPAEYRGKLEEAIESLCGEPVDRVISSLFGEDEFAVRNEPDVHAKVLGKVNEFVKENVLNRRVQHLVFLLDKDGNLQTEYEIFDDGEVEV